MRLSLSLLRSLLISHLVFRYIVSLRHVRPIYRNNDSNLQRRVCSKRKHHVNRVNSCDTVFVQNGLWTERWLLHRSISVVACGFLADCCAVACAPGSFKAGLNNNPCSQCLANQYSSSYQSTTCQNCPVHTVSAAGATSLSSCVCQPGYSGSPGSSCSGLLLITLLFRLVFVVELFSVL